MRSRGLPGCGARPAHLTLGTAPFQETSMPAKLRAEPPARDMTLDRFSDLTEDAMFVLLLISGVVAAVAIIVLALAL
jgi:hypothetical protein